MKLDHPGLALSNMLGIVAVVSCCFNHEKRTFGYFSGSFLSIFILSFCGCQFLDPLVQCFGCHAMLQWNGGHSTAPQDFLRKVEVDQSQRLQRARERAKAGIDAVYISGSIVTTSL